jgi:hypothetical protein
MSRPVLTAAGMALFLRGTIGRQHANIDLSILVIISRNDWSQSRWVDTQPETRTENRKIKEGKKQKYLLTHSLLLTDRALGGTCAASENA